MKHASLFSGIGGFDLAAEWMEWENIFHCELNPFGRRVLKYYWPNAESFIDITKTDFTPYANKIDILTGGFPCQPYSTAGKRLGTEDERHLWPEMLRAIREIKPTWVVGENVLGLISWNGGLVFEEVQSDLEAEGYEVQPYVLPAASVNAPHRRDRVWFVAYSQSNRNNRAPDETSGTAKRQDRHEVAELSKRGQIRTATNPNSSTTGPSRTSSETESNRSKNNDEPKSWGQSPEQHIGCSELLQHTTDTNDQGLQRSTNKGIVGESGTERNKQPTRHFCTKWENFPTVSPICNGNDGIPDRLDGITFSKWRAESVKAGGNAIVPQVALEIFKAIEAHVNSIKF